MAGQAHVFRITRASARCAERSLGAGGARAAIERLAGALPQNVERSIADWVRDVRPPLRLRSAIFVDAGDAASAEALVAGPLAGLVVERLGESLLAVAGRGLAEVERALAGAGHELEPGLDRVSGSWLAAATAYIGEELARHPRLAVVGDMNIAPEDRDVHDPDLWRNQVMCSDAERAAFRDWQALGLKDAFRLFEQPDKTFSWWDYRMLAFPKNHGLRIDHILLSPALATTCTSCTIDRPQRKGEKPSDHAPVVAELG